MLDIKYVRENQEAVAEAMKNRNASWDAERFSSLDENRRAAAEAEALRKRDFPAFLALVNASGASSWQYLQNVTSGDLRQQALAVTLAVCRRALGGQGAVRVHGGGFAGTALAFVPDDRREMFRRTVEQTLGVDKCRLLSVRNPLAHSGRYC